MTQPSIVVLGSCVIDLVLSVPTLPVRGETMIADASAMFVGGKGVNQAIAAARSEAHATMIGRVGADPFGTHIIEALDAAGVDRHHVLVDPTAMTGLGVPLVDPSGANAIVFVAGANDQVSESDVAAAEPAIRAADMLLLQLELPAEIALAATRVAANAGTKVLLNAAPAVPIPPGLAGAVDVLVVNEIEARQLAGGHDGSLGDVVVRLADVWDPAIVIVTLGEEGVFVHDRSGVRGWPAFAVDSLDAVGAGDAFCAGLAVELCRGTPLDGAVAYGQAAGALTTAKPGAVPAIPTRAEIIAFMDATPRPT
jgi:ribokinase